MQIRDAVMEDAPEAADVMRRSISELCYADHRNDPEILKPWLANKTPEIVGSWIVAPGNSLMVAVEDGRIVGVGSATAAGEIRLNYVCPTARFRGVSRALLVAMEARARERCVVRCHLFSTETARRFYRDAGYTEDGAPNALVRTSSGYPMSKLL